MQSHGRAARVWIGRLDGSGGEGGTVDVDRHVPQEHGRDGEGHGDARGAAPYYRTRAGTAEVVVLKASVIARVSPHFTAEHCRRAGYHHAGRFADRSAPYRRRDAGDERPRARRPSKGGDAQHQGPVHNRIFATRHRPSGPARPRHRAARMPFQSESLAVRVRAILDAEILA
jgi:hypothetical protein